MAMMRPHCVGVRQFNKHTAHSTQRAQVLHGLHTQDAFSGKPRLRRLYFRSGFWLLGRVRCGVFSPLKRRRKMWLPILLTCLAACYIFVIVIAQASRWCTRRRYGVAQGATMVGFFHPFCAGGGGGERVLWRAVHALSHLSEDRHESLHVLIYTGDVGMTPEAILSGVARQFEISINTTSLPVSFVYLRGRTLLDAGLYPVLTMLAQSAASVVLAAEALFRGTPDVFVDTTGFAFSFPVAWLAGCSVGAYVHYPTISTVSGYCRNQGRYCSGARFLRQACFSSEKKVKPVFRPTKRS